MAEEGSLADLPRQKADAFPDPAEGTVAALKLHGFPGRGGSRSRSTRGPARGFLQGRRAFKYHSGSGLGMAKVLACRGSRNPRPEFSARV